MPVYDMTDSRSLGVRGRPPAGLQTGLELPAKAAGVNRWGAPTAAPASPDPKPRTKPPPPLATDKAPPQPRTKPPPPVQTPPVSPFTHDPALDPGTGSNSDGPPPLTAPPLHPPPQRQERGREPGRDRARSRYRDTTPTREQSPSLEPQARTIPFSMQRSQTETGRPRNRIIVPHTRQGKIHQDYRTPQATRWSRAERCGAIPLNGPFSNTLFVPNIKPDMPPDWYEDLHDRFTSLQGVIQAEMCQRGGPPFLHLSVATHQLAVNGKHYINDTVRTDLRHYGGEDKSLRATWSRAPPTSAPPHLTEQAWTMWQLFSFDGHRNHRPNIPPPTHPATWATWYLANYNIHSSASWMYESAFCPPDIFAEYMRNRLQVEQDPAEDSAQDTWSVAS